MLYFIDGKRNGGAKVYAEHGLTDLLESPVCREYLASGPGGKSGIVIASGGDVPRYDAAKQTWSRRFGQEGSYVGCWNDNRPGPEQLARKEQLPGAELRFLDGKMWLVPVLRQWRDKEDRVVFATALPTILQRSPLTGRLVSGAVVLPLQSLWSRSCEIASALISQSKGGSLTIDTDELDGYIADLLAVNYRVTLDEISLLGLLDIDLYRKILFASLDWDRMRALVGNLQRRLIVAGTQAMSLDSDSGEVQPIAADSTNIGQP